MRVLGPKGPTTRSTHRLSPGPVATMMLALQFVFWVLCCCGVTQIVTKSWIFHPLRRFLHRRAPQSVSVLFSCPMCFGFWVGVFWSLTLGIGPACQTLPERWYIVAFLNGVCSSVVCWWVHLLSHLAGEAPFLKSLDED